MNKLRKILFPFSILYGIIVAIRNLLFDKGILIATKFSIPTIVVGNLNVGGTGKSPQIEYLARLLKNNYKVAILSRGYKRKTTGFQIADDYASAEDIGDEPLQFYKKFKEVTVAVDSDRVNGINQLQGLETKPNVVLLDDAYQHRKVTPGFSILLTAYHDLYADDMILPAGNLRENRAGANRANIIIVSKCPEKLSPKEQQSIIQKLQPQSYQTVFFSKITYNDAVMNQNNTLHLNALKKYKVLLVTGIANSNPLIQLLQEKKIDIKHLEYGDHYNFTPNDFNTITTAYDNLKASNKIILTTEKDYVRSLSQCNNSIYYLPIKTSFLENQDQFDTLVLNYITTAHHLNNK